MPYIELSHGLALSVYSVSSDEWRAALVHLSTSSLVGRRSVPSCHASGGGCHGGGGGSSGSVMRSGNSCISSSRSMTLQ
eukprot:3449426-Heterocapsa_arctica.AAC.1